MELPQNLQQILDMVSELKVIELSQLVKAMEEKFGVSAAAAVASGPATSAPVEEEKNTFDIELTSFGEKKLDVIKIVKNITGLGLGEAKALVESAPKMIKEQVAKDEAKKIADELKAAGATVTLK